MKYAGTGIARDRPCMHHGLQGQGSWPLRARQHGRGPGRVPQGCAQAARQACRRLRGRGARVAKLRGACARERIEFGLGSPCKTRIVRMTAGKNDKGDAEKIAGLLGRGAFPARRPGGREAASLRDLTRAAIALARDRTRICNRLCALLARYGLRLRVAKICSNKALTRIRGTAFGSHADSTNVRRLVKQMELPTERSAWPKRRFSARRPAQGSPRRRGCRSALPASTPTPRCRSPQRQAA